MEDDDGLLEVPSSKIVIGRACREFFSIQPEDPLSAEGSAFWVHRVGRGHWQTRTESWTRMWCDAESFYLEAELRAFEDDEQIFEKRWSEKIPRDHL